MEHLVCINTVLHWFSIEQVQSKSAIFQSVYFVKLNYLQHNPAFMIQMK